MPDGAPRTAAGDPVRVLRVIARLNMGGPALHVAYLTAGLAERGYETTLVAGKLARGEGSMAWVAESRGVSVVRLDDLSREIAPFHDARSILRLARTIRALRPDVLHTHTAKAGAVGRIAALLAGDARPRVIVHTFHGHVLRGYFGRLKSAGFAVLERWLARVSTRLIAVSPEVRDDLVALGVAPREKFAVIRLGIGLDERIGAPGTGRDPRALLGLGQGQFTIGWVGRMTGVKRTADAIDALRLLRADGVDAVLVLIGDGPDRDALEQHAGKAGVMRHCLFLGYQDDVAPWYQTFDALVLPSANEGTPVVVIEALAAGCPVVATAVGGVPDVVREGVDGFLVGAGDVEALAERLGALARDPGLRARMAASGRSTVPARYAVERLVGDVDELYRSLLGR